VLESRLRARGDGVLYETLDFGTPGYNTQLELELLRDKGLAYRPDIVLVGWCDNDFDLPCFVREREPWWDSLLPDLLANRTRFFRRWNGGELLDPHQVEANRITDDTVTGTQEAGVESALAALQALGRAHGFRVLLVGPPRSRILDICRRLRLDYCNTLEKIPPGRVPADGYVHAMHPAPPGTGRSANGSSASWKPAGG
jgi:hypothetical protein